MGLGAYSSWRERRIVGEASVAAPGGCATGVAMGDDLGAKARFKNKRA